MDQRLHKKSQSLDWGDLLFLLGMVLALGLFFYPRLDQPTWEVYDSWRQSDTLAMARNLLKTGNFFKPMLNYDGLEGTYVQLELPILPGLTTLLLSTGLPIHYLARALSMTFFIGSALYFYLLCRELYSKGASIFACLFYVLAPLSLKYGRAIMPESLVLFFFAGSLYHLYLFYKSGSMVQFYLTAMFTSLSILQKIPAAFTGILILYCLFRKWGAKKVFKSPHTYLFGLISLGIPLVYFYQASLSSGTNYVNGIAQANIFTIEGIRSQLASGWSFLLTNYQGIFGPVLLVLAGLGLLLALYHQRGFVLMLTLAYGLEMVLIVYSIKFQYYMVFQVLVLALLTGEYFNYFAYDRHKFIILVCGLLVLFHGYYGVKEYWVKTKVDDRLDREIASLKERTYLKDNLAINGGNPIYLNALPSYGYRADVKEIRTYPSEPAAQAAFFKEKGVRYYVSMKDQSREEYDGYYRDHFDIIDQDDQFTVYDLERGK